MELSEEEIIRNVKRIIEYKVISNYINNYDCRVIQGLLDLYYKQQKELKEWFEIADKILRATNDYGNITIGYIPIYIDKLQKDIEELMKINTPMSWEMKDKDGNVVVSLKKPDDYISKDRIREKRDEIQSYAFTSEEDKKQQDYAIARFNELLKEN